MKRVKKLFQTQKQLVATFLGVIIGIVLGFTVKAWQPAPKVIVYLNFPGEIFMNLLKMMVLPLISSSLVSGLCQLDAKKSGKMGGYAFLYYTITTSSAVILGICLVLVIHPGNTAMKNGVILQAQKSNINGADKFMDIIRNLFPDNIMEAMFRQSSTRYIYKNASDPGSLILIHEKHEGINILGVIVFCIAIGISLSVLEERGKALAEVFISMDHVIAFLVKYLMWYAPIGICSLIAAKIASTGDLGQIAKSLGLFAFTVLFALGIHLFGTISLVYFVATRRNPYLFLRGLIPAALTALGTSSSAASLPVTFNCLEVNNKVDPRYTKFVLPVGAVVNMDGTALYEAVASIFIAQINGIDLSFSQVITVSITATLASIGAAAIPSGGLVTLIIVLSALGLPAEDISLIMTIDWFLGRFRACVNICGDGFGCGFVQAFCEASETQGSSQASSTFSKDEIEKIPAMYSKRLRSLTD